MRPRKRVRRQRQIMAKGGGPNTAAAEKSTAVYEVGRVAEVAARATR